MNTKPKCIIVTGRPGAGKTTLSKKLGCLLGMPVISRDEIKEGYVSTFGVKHDQLPSDTNLVVSDLFFEIIYQYVANKVSIIIEAAFQHKTWEPRIPRIIELSQACIVVCSIDAEVAARRHLRRGLEDPRREFFHGDKRVSLFKSTGVMSPPVNHVAPHFNVPTIHVSTEGEYSPGLDDIVHFIQISRA